MQSGKILDQTHSLFEYTSIRYDEIKTRDLNKTQLIIEKLNHEAGNKLLRFGRDHFSATQFVGLIQAGDVAFEILPKIDYPLGAN